MTTVARLSWIAALAAAYVITARLGLKLDAVAGFATLVWPPTGIALAALLLGGRWLWPGVFLGALVVNAWAGASPLAAAAIAGGNTLEAVLGAFALTRLGCDPRLERVTDIASLIVAAALGSTLVSATVGVATLYASGVVTGAGLAVAWRAWWVGDAIGDLIVAPLLLVWWTPPRLPAPRARIVEGAAVCVLSLACSFAVFGGKLAMGIHLLFAPLVWAAVRLRQRGSSLAILIISASAIAGTAAGHGPFTHAELHNGLLELQSFMGLVTAVTLLLGAAVAERDHARRVAVEALQGRDDFLSIASHELRTPLGALGLQLGTMRHLLAKGGTLSSDRIERAERQTDRLAHLVTTLLDVSRVESGQLRVHPEPMDLAELVRDVVDRSAEEANTARCEVRVSATMPVHGAWDRLRLEQVLSNLLSNAFRHAAGSPIDVNVTADDQVARLEVRDHGPGVAQDQLEALFGRYRRGNAERERGGLGLGLYISRHVVEAHSGTLTARGKLGEGCVFTVALPLRGSYSRQDGPR